MPTSARPSRFGSPLSSALVLMLGLLTVSCGDGAGGSSSNGGQAGASTTSTTSTAGAGGTTSTGGTGGDTSVITRTCEDPQPLLQIDGSESGFVQCKDGSYNHEKSVVCQPVPDEDTCDPAAGYPGNCKTSADCTEHAIGYCMVDFPIPSGQPTCGCEYQCQTDADCGPDEICGCGTDGGWPTCISVKNCKQDADCPSGECGVSYNSNGCLSSAHLGCRTDQDQCRVLADCSADEDNCSQMGADKWTCSTFTCIP